MYVELKGSSQATKSITLPLEEYQSMLDEMKKLKEDNSMLCRGANVIKVLKVDALFRKESYHYLTNRRSASYYEELSFNKEYSDDVTEKFKDRVFEILKDKERLQEEVEDRDLIISELNKELTEKNNQISELENKKGLGFIMFMVGCFVGGMLMSMQ